LTKKKEKEKERRGCVHRHVSCAQRTGGPFFFFPCQRRRRRLTKGENHVTDKRIYL
jgi:hypothetical protein